MRKIKIGIAPLLESLVRAWTSFLAELEESAVKGNRILLEQIVRGQIGAASKPGFVTDSKEPNVCMGCRRHGGVRMND
jgi:hypothetical protein